MFAAFFYYKAVSRERQVFPCVPTSLDVKKGGKPMEQKLDLMGKEGYDVLMNARQKSQWALGMTVLSFAAMALWTKRLLAQSEIASEQIVFVRFVFGFLVLLGWRALGHSLNPKNYRVLLLRGVLGGSSVLLYFLSLQRLPTGVAALINYSWPLFAVLWAFLFLKERPSVPMVVAFLVSLLGMFVVVWDARNTNQAIPHSMVGLGFGLLGTVLSGAAITTLRSARQSEGSWELFGAFCLVGALFAAPLSLAHWRSPTWVQWLYLLGIAGSSVVGQLSMTYAFKEASAVLGGLVMLSIPVVIMAAGRLWLGETMGWVGMLASAVTIGGVGYGVWRDAQKNQRVKSPLEKNTFSSTPGASEKLC